MSIRVHDIPVSLIDMGDRLRPVDPSELAKIRISMAEIGQLQPISVRQADPAGRHLLISGGHRLVAAQELGWAKIQAVIVEASDDEARIQEIDENLCRHELNPLDRATFLSERQAIYERLHPEAKHGGDRRRSSRQVGDLKSPAFIKEVAERTGISSRTVSRALTLASDLAPDAVAAVRGTALATNQAELEALRKVERVHQAAVARAVLDGRAKRVAEAEAMILQRQPKRSTKTSFDRMVALWGSSATTPADRRNFTAWLVKAGHLAPYGVALDAQPTSKKARGA